MKVLLCTPPWRTTEMWPPLGLLYIAGSIKRERGDEVAVIDAFCRNLTKDQLTELAVREHPDVVGMNCSTHTFEAAISALAMIHEALPDATIVMGGYHPTFSAREIIAAYSFVHYIIKGEAEQAFPRLLGHIEAGTEPANVEGIVFRSGDEWVENPLTLIEDLDSLPFPDRDLLGDLRYGYSFQGIPLTFGRFTTVTSSRGCPFSCAYCSCAAFSERKWRCRSPQNVVDELESLYRQGYRECVFVDDNLTERPYRVEEMCRLIVQRGIRMKLYCEGRASHADPSLLRTMRTAGFNVIYFGAESATPHVLEYYNKRQDPGRIAQAVANAKQAGMLVITSYILGAPVESREDMKETIRFAGSLRPHGVQYNILDLLPGTPLWEDLRTQGMVGNEDWRTNHRVYEYFPEHASKEELEGLVNEGYGSFMTAWKNGSGVLELLRILMVNPTARSVVLRNLSNPAARSAIMGGIRQF